MLFHTKSTLNVGGKIIDLSTPKVMGILNITPDSFFDGNKYLFEKDFLLKAEQMLVDGANIIDVGGYSTRPNASEVNVEEEIARIKPVLKSLKKFFPEAILSIDTFRSQVAEIAVSEGAAIINDVSGGNIDDQMFNTVAKCKVPYILMHMRGTPQTMSKLNEYNNITTDILDELLIKIKVLKELNVKDIIVDPGFGFAKNIDQNYLLLKNLSYFKVLEFPIMVGVSRKSMIYKVLDITSDEALNGTSVLNTIAILNGASLLRVHDVKQAVEAIKLVKKYLN
jgi:dihydropteroate synthase